MRRPATIAALMIPLAFAARTAAADTGEAPSREAVAFFEAKVRPVLVEKCQACHGAKKQWSGLRLDSREAALAGGDLGPAVVPGKPEESLLIEAVNHVDGLEMPPKKPKLDPDRLADLAEWVRMGAPWPADAAVTADAADPADHWAFRPVAKPDPPALSGDWGRNEVDAFLLATLRAKGLEPAPPADRRTLIRRATFDLTGLPPTPEEVDAFLADESPDAYEKVVDRLLASPHYGERWGRHWLDVARYADTKGYVFQEERRYPYAYTYRDWVIAAFNADLPYDQFILRQVAADKLPGLEPREQAAMGFLTVGRRFLNNGHDIIDDRIDVVTRGFLGLTVACARCHDHKYDPIPTADYYALYGVFNSSVEPDDAPELPSDAPAEQVAAFEQELEKARGEVEDFRRERLKKIRADLRANLPAYLAAARAIEYQGRHEALDDTARAGELRPETLRWLAPRWGRFLDGGGDALATLRALPPAARVATLGSLGFDAGALGKLLAALPTPPGAPTGPDAAALRAALEDGDGPLAFADEELRRLFNRADRDAMNGLTRKVDALKATHPGAPPRAMVLVDRPSPVEPRIFVRGNPDRQGDVVPRRFLEILSGPDREPFADGSGRLELARAIADPANPLTARVMVNRIWQGHFGRGIVASASDFGRRGETPSHPELLDWLAATFVERGWSVKAIHRLVMLSDAYRQRSDDRPEVAAVDPEDALLWKFPRRRLDFEAMRDALLAAAGRLDSVLGGRPVELTEAPFPTRRTVYGFIDRQNLPGVFRAFDFASPDASAPRRYVTVVPQQALFLMNNPFAIEQARHAAEVEPSADPEARIRALYRRLFQRSPEPHELELGLAFVADARFAPPEPAAGPWTQGYGRFDPESGRVVDFQPLPHWTGQAWQFGPNLPDPAGSYLSLTATGGHPGDDGARAAIRRWVAPKDATVSISGRLGHGSPKGDGVRARVVSSRRGELGTWDALDAKVPTRLAGVEVEAGEALDFVVDPIGGPAFDSFDWAPKIREGGGEGVPPVAAWDARADFAGPPPRPLDPWAAYAQVLMLTNEFAYID